MKKHNILAVVCISSLTAGLALAKDASKEQTYTLYGYQDCNLVKTYVLNQEQTDAYKELKRAGKLMETLESPIHGIEKRLRSLSKDIEHYTKLAIQEDAGSIHIDKAALAKQESIAKELEALVDAHEKDFDALSEQGDKISDIADKFTALLDADIDTEQYDRVEITSDSQPDSTGKCYM